MTTNLNRKGVVHRSRDNQIIVRGLRRAGRLIVRDHGTRRTLWSGKRFVRRLKRRDRHWSLLCFKFPLSTSTSTLLSNLKALLTTLAFLKPNIIERRRCVDNSTVLRSFNVRVDLTR
jgi:hypothetical protein